VFVLLAWGLIELPVGLVELPIRAPPVFLLELLQRGVPLRLLLVDMGGASVLLHAMGACLNLFVMLPPSVVTVLVSALEPSFRPLNTITSTILDTNWCGCRFYLGISYFILFC
jgi:hypothetical protein